MLFYSIYGFKVLRFLGYKNIMFLKPDSQQTGISQILDFILVDIIVNSLYYGFCISICFFFLGTAVSFIYKYFSKHAPKLYLFDLLGAALGCVLANVLIRYLQFNSIPIFLSFLAGLLSCIIAVRSSGARYTKYFSYFIMIISIYTGYLNLTTGFLEIKRSPNLAVLDYQLKDDVRELWYEWNAYSRLSLLSNRKRGETQTKYLFTIDNGKGNVHLRKYDRLNPYKINLYEEFTPVSLAYLNDTPKELLVMFAGAGIDMLQAHSYSKGITNITGVELDPSIVHYAKKLHHFHLKDFLELDNVMMYAQEGRDFLNSTQKKYDSIIYSWGGASFSNYLGTSGYSGRYLYTKEAMVSLIQHLNINGTIGIVNANKLRLVAIIKAAFEELGYHGFENHILIFGRKGVSSNTLFDKGIYSSLSDHVVLFKKSEFTGEELKRIIENAQRLQLDLIYSPDFIQNGFEIYGDLIHSTDTAFFMDQLSRKVQIDLSISTDNKPFIDNLFYPQIILDKDFWNKLDKLSRKESTKQYTLNLYTLWFIVFLIMMAFVFILLPLLLTQRFSSLKQDFPFLYFFSVLGVGFILIEIAIMNQFILFLGNPIYSFSLILASLLTSLGIGSYCSNWLFEKKIVSLKNMAFICSVFLIGYFFILPFILHNWLGIPFLIKITVTFIIILPLGTCLGMMFPQGLKKLSAYNNNLIPWAWGLNGYMSTVGSAISIYLSMMVGFNWFILIAAFLYFSLVFIPWND